jgi:hypothetical protein
LNIHFGQKWSFTNVISGTKFPPKLEKGRGADITLIAGKSVTD